MLLEVFRLQYDSVQMVAKLICFPLGFCACVIHEEINAWGEVAGDSSRSIFDMINISSTQLSKASRYEPRDDTGASVVRY